MTYCNTCKKTITLDVYKTSWAKYHKALCVECQKSYSAPHGMAAVTGGMIIRESRNGKEDKITDEAMAIGAFLKLKGWDVKFEHSDGYKHVDIAILEANVYIEVDGPLHALKKEQALKDLKRTYYSFKNDNIVTLRIPNCLVQNPTITRQTAEFINGFLMASKARASEFR